ncbi:MAG: hypothetical protein SFT94_07425 [Pseudanabaenaceae cyanobacterium bins.68]|nr:hypothetical protein [Pseudanabaenaceae cyanobacterium bins.68]
MNLETVWQRIGDWNPQILRELRGKLKLRNVAIALIAAALIQILIVGAFSLGLPDPDLASAGKLYSQFCFGTKEYSYQSVFLCSLPLEINWQLWWAAQFRLLSWTLPILPVAVGGGMLALDLAQEASRGTFNFVRLSPQAASSILLGKLWGVPCLVYLATLAVLPLHLVAAIGAGVDPLFLLSYYLLNLLGAYLFGSVAMLVGLVAINSGSKFNNPLNVGMGLGFVFSGLYQVYLFLNSISTWAPFGQLLYGGDRPNLVLEWFNLAIASNFWLGNGFAITSVLVVSQGIWYALERRYYTPTRPLIAKRQAYICLAFLQIFMVGFLVNRTLGDYLEAEHLRWAGLAVLNGINYWCFLSLITILTPTRQATLDWLRYRHLQSRRSLWQDLVWHEQSPAVVAIALCSLIAALVITPWAVGAVDFGSGLAMISLIIAQGVGFVILALIYQILAFWAKTKPQRALAIALLIGTLIVPPLLMVFLPLPKFLWVMIGYPAFAYSPQLSWHLAIGGLAQGLILATGGLALTRQLQRAARSEFELLSDATRTATPQISTHTYT